MGKRSSEGGEGNKLVGKRKKVEVRQMDLISEEKEGE